MTKQQAIEYFGGVRELASAIGVSTPAIYQWDEIPLQRQYQIQVITKGRLKANQPDAKTSA